jgi:CheY-like chemotaxis protein
VIRQKVLIVEDTVSLRRAFVRSVLIHGHKVVGVESCAIAWILLNDFKLEVDLVISDYEMPHPMSMDGLELLRQIRLCEWTRNTPFVLMSGRETVNGDELLQLQGIAERSGARFLRKPIENLARALNLDDPRRAVSS